MAQSVLRYNVVIVNKFFNKGSWTSEAWQKGHLEEFDDPEGQPERIATVDERRGLLQLNQDLQNAVCAAPGHATSTECSVDVGRREKPWKST